LGNLGRESVYRELGEIVEEGFQKWSISLSGIFVKGTWRRKRRLWRWALLSMGASTGKPERGLICQGLMRGRKFWDGCLST